ncbi:hypothetical protein Q5762_29845 [Streptomyces sp. P9(2023)]|uniref:hypothetical protein n=1 Tax=Streptomyces sp. P9(2023) TaxID=3064394 RepID=UPI0028F429E4|nr:hypothetical protein [Streptomyces sp. P9(2023)]MDT9692461.1 hypothetical protein [Streptomyces sp. P9(2023)]
MVRNVIGSVLALAGATAAVWSPFRAWYDGRHGSDYRIEDLFGGITDVRAEVIGSLLLPFAFAAVVTLLGVVLRSRLLVAFAGLVVLGFTILWMVRVGQAEGSLTVGGDGTGLGDGVANAFGGGLLLLLGALVMSGRTRARSMPLEPEPTYPVHPDQPTRPTHPTLDGGPYTAPPPADHPTRTMDVPTWDGTQDWDQDRDRTRIQDPGAGSNDRA